MHQREETRIMGWEKLGIFRGQVDWVHRVCDQIVTIKRGDKPDYCPYCGMNSRLASRDPRELVFDE